MHRWYAKNRVIHIARVLKNARERRLMLKELLNGYKRVPCTDCGVRFPPYVMDFDHVRGEKVANLSRLKTIRSLAKILVEVEKCEIVCANCHRLRTQARLKGLKVTPSEIVRRLGPNYVSVLVYA